MSKHFGICWGQFPPNPNCGAAIRWHGRSTKQAAANNGKALETCLKDSVYTFVYSLAMLPLEFQNADNKFYQTPKGTGFTGYHFRGIHVMTFTWAPTPHTFKSKTFRQSNFQTKFCPKVYLSRNVVLSESFFVRKF